MKLHRANHRNLKTLKLFTKADTLTKNIFNNFLYRNSNSKHVVIKYASTNVWGLKSFKHNSNLIEINKSIPNFPRKKRPHKTNKNNSIYRGILNSMIRPESIKLLYFIGAPPISELLNDLAAWSKSLSPKCWVVFYNIDDGFLKNELLLNMETYCLNYANLELTTIGKGRKCSLYISSADGLHIDFNKINDLNISKSSSKYSKESLNLNFSYYDIKYF